MLTVWFAVMMCGCAIMFSGAVLLLVGIRRTGWDPEVPVWLAFVSLLCLGAAVYLLGFGAAVFDPEDIMRGLVWVAGMGIFFSVANLAREERRRLLILNRAKG